jgi:hypothetical protein
VDTGAWRAELRCAFRQGSERRKNRRCGDHYVVQGSSNAGLRRRVLFCACTSHHSLSSEDFIINIAESSLIFGTRHYYRPPRLPRHQQPWLATVRSSSLGARLTDAGQQPPHYLPVRIATRRDSLHRLLSKGLSLLFGLSLAVCTENSDADVVVMVDRVPLRRRRY